MDLIGTVDNYGAALLEYICATEPGTFPKAAWDAQLEENRPRLSARQQEVLDSLSEIPPPLGQPRIVIPSSIVVSVDPESGHVTANLLRLRAGGELPDVSEADPVLSPLLAIAIEGFPSLLITNEQMMRAGSLPGNLGSSPAFLVDEIATVFHRHPRRDETLNAITEDHELADLLARENDQPTGNRPHDSLNLALSMLKGAALSLLAGPNELTADALVDEARRQVDGARRLGRGESVEGTLLVALSGLALGGDADRIELPWGTVLSPKPRLRMIGGTGLHSWESVSTLLHVPIEFGPGEPDPNLYARALSATRLLALAALMAEGRAGSPVPVAAWTTILGPLADGRASRSPMPLPFPQPNPTPLDSPRVELLREWCSFIEAVDSATLDRIAIAIDRLIAAVSEHAVAADALLDAVMVWENLFGSKEETTFKVTAALTIVTVAEPRDRPETLKKLRETYTVRSNFVHASEALEPSTIAVHRDRAIDVGIAALRVLFRKRPDLLARTSSKRAEAILLDLPSGG